ncbi:hypothetical protein FRZ03_07855 [Streptomyces misionensis]|uniref:Uncharacterized protein n=1 Tax=Streptomyces misionensis TaxID=67331 RepID=A0A5C6JZ54_9ACTN|nr:hypothetical protein [Streptomyces misionensis]TWV55436.1 hypothetical protein FRZ03_07855 [Streptomyces misionensis]
MSLFPGIVAAVQKERSATVTDMAAYRSVLAHGAHGCFQLGLALSLAAGVVALLTLTRIVPVPRPAPASGLSDGAPAGTPGSPGS